MTKERLQYFIDKMIHHDVENDMAIVKLTAKELHELLDEIQVLQKNTNYLSTMYGRTKR